MQEVVIKIKGDSSDIIKLGNELKNLGKIDEENAKQFKKTNDEVKKQNKEKADSFGFLGDQIKSLKNMIVGAFAVESIISFGKAMIEVTAEFQKYNAVLTNTLGSQEAAATAMSMIQDFASKTPFSVAELTDSFVKLANQGFKPTMAQMTSLGDLAASQGKSFDQLTEALIDAQVGEFERLKEFGIRASKQGDQVAFTFKGVTTTVANTSEAMRDYVTSLGNVEGVAGGMAKISETLGGKISNLGDNWDKLLFTLGSKSSGVIAGTIDLLNELMDQAIMASKSIDQIRNEARQASTARELEDETKLFLDYIDKIEKATGKTFDFNKAKQSYIKTIIDSINNAKEDGRLTDTYARSLTNELKAVQAVTQSRKQHEEQLKSEAATKEKTSKKQEKVDETWKKGRKDIELMRSLELEGTKELTDKELEAEVKKNNAIFQAREQHIIDMSELEAEWAQDKQKQRDEDIKLAIASAEFTINLGQTLVNAMNLQGKEAEAAQKGFALADIAISTAKAIAYLTASSAQVALEIAKVSGPAAIFTGPAAYAAYYGTQIVTILANMLSAKQILGYAHGTPSLQRNGNPAGVDTIPIMANEGEAIIPTDKNRQNPGLAAAWIKGNLDDYINVKYVIPALKRNKAGKDEDFANRLGKAISMNGTFNDMNLLESDKENRRILRSIDKTLKSSSHGLSRRKF